LSKASTTTTPTTKSRM
jgi:hypothetical protein